MFKLHKQQISGSIHSGHFMVSRLDDDEDDDDQNNNEQPDDSSERGDNATNVEIDVNDPESVVEASKGLDLGFRAENPPTKNEHLTSWNDLDRPSGKHSQKQHQYLTYYTTVHPGPSSSASSSSERVGLTRAPFTGTTTPTAPINATNKFLNHHHHQQQQHHNHHHHHQQPPQSDALNLHYSTSHLSTSTSHHMNQQHHHLMSALSASGDPEAAAAALSGLAEAGKELLPPRLANLDHLHQHHHLQDHQKDEQQCTIIQAHHQHHQHHHHHPHHQHAVTIDTSLTKLLECMSLYYSSKLTSPKWKSFKGLKLRLKYKIRLNNLIWRAWFLQCIRGRRQPGCQFTAPAETEVHKKSETIVLEGKYWKRKEKAIVDEYNKWRTFHKQKSCNMTCFRPSSFDWDSRASNLATSSIFGQDYRFYPDYDMNISYNLEDLPIALEDATLREPDNYYLPSAFDPSQPQMIRIIEQQHRQQQQNYHHQQQQQQQQQQQNNQQQHQQQHHPHQHLMQHHQTLHHHLHQQPQQQHLNSNIPPQHHIQQQHQHQLAQLQISANDPHTAASQIAPKRELTVPVSSNYSSIEQRFSHQHHPTMSNNNQRQAVPLNFDSNSHYQPHHQQLNGLPLHMQHHHHHQQQQLSPIQPQAAAIHHLMASQQPQMPQNQPMQQQQHPQSQPQPQHQQPPLPPSQQPTPMSMDQDMYQGSSGEASDHGRNEQRRVCHINAEQKRRCNIKNGFDTLKSILPSINQNINVKISKASMLQKAAMYISSLSADQKQLLEERDLLKQQIEHLKQSINTYQCQLPASGAPVGQNQESTRAKETLQEYVRTRTLSNWKFWIFSLLIEPLFDSYYRSVNINSLEESCKTIFTWLDTSCGLVSLRKDILESLTLLSTRTDVLNTPQTLPTEAVDAVNYQPELTSSNGSQSQQVPNTAITTTTATNNNRLVQPAPTLSAQNFFIS